MPDNIVAALAADLKPSIGRIRRLIRRWSCSIRLFMYWLCRMRIGFSGRWGAWRAAVPFAVVLLVIFPQVALLLPNLLNGG
ncbi:hypothetical protein MesoLjLc_76630 [Mesorhizobium sp. L-8-10]|nr:hypothetical protein MesoLjLb_75690 [Mesorhizobium sp. L-8-3]BCH35733.1 hypothetical protein MesoLjLc_76630 [Mesorhizobium sp. L-8-10]